MHQSEGDNQLARGSSSQTLRKGPLHHAINEEDECQLPKQVHGGENNGPYEMAHDEEDKRSYKSTENGRRLSKNMKESLGP